MKDYRIIPKTKPKQLVVLLHGVGANGQDLLGLGDVWQSLLPDCAFISPDAHEAYDMAPFGRQWFSLRDRDAAKMDAGVERARPVVDMYLDGLLNEFSLPANRLALVGFSQGTMVSLYAGVRRKEKLAGILGYSGALLASEKLHDGIITRPPIALVHGTMDEVVPVAASRFAHQLLKNEGCTVDLHLCDGLGHGIDNVGLSAGAAFLQRIFS
jgi:phospholipase/carboxylesterase